jgi:hypothetical protein
LRRHGESIYGASHSPFSVGEQNWRCTAKPGKLYFHMLRWPAGGRFVVRGLMNNVKAACLLSDPAQVPLKFEKAGTTLTVQLPGDAPDAYCPVLAVGIDGEPNVEQAYRWDAPRDAITLTARESSPHGPWVRYSEFDQTVSGFVEGHDKMLWHLLVREPGKFNVEVEYSAGTGEVGDTIRLEVFGQQFTAKTENTEGRFRWAAMGVLEARKAGLEQALLHVKDPRVSATLRVRAVRLARSR